MPTKYWSKHVTETSDALDLTPGIFDEHDPKKIARSLKKSAQGSHRRKTDPFRSAMSMLTFYINRAGKNLPARQRHVLEEAKDELRKEFGREPSSRNRSSRRTQSSHRSTSAKRARRKGSTRKTTHRKTSHR